MRITLRAICAAIAATCLMSPATAGPAPAGTVHRVEKFDVTFLYESGGGYEEYVVIATRTTDAATGQILDVTVVAGVRQCVLEDGSLTCQGRLHDGRVIRFETSADFGNGTVTFRDRRGRRNHLSLVATDPYQATGRDVPNSCGGATIDAYEHAYNASATGTLFGRKVTTRGDADPEAEAMTRYVEVEGCP